MKNYIRADYRRALTCRPHIVEMIIAVVLIIGVPVWKAVTATGNWNSVAYADAISFPMFLVSLLLGMCDILAVFSQDFKAKTIQIAIGRGIRRPRVVAVKLIDVALLTFTDLALLTVLTMALSFIIGAPLTGPQLAQHLIDILELWLEWVGYTAIVLPLLFHLQSMLVPILIYLLFTCRAVYGILRMFTFWGPEWMQKLHLESYTLDAFLDGLKTHLIMGRLNVGSLIGVVVYLVLGYVAAVAIFRRQELEF